MMYEATTTGAQPVRYEEPDSLTQTELEELVKKARQVKTRKAERMTIERHATTGRLWIKVWRAA